MSLKTIINSQNLNKVDSLFLFKYIFIPLAWPITWLFIFLGIKPNHATFIRLIVIIVSYFLVLFHSDYTLLSFILIYISLILDCVDGQIARTLDLATHFGKFFDGLIDNFLGATFPVIIAVAHYKIHNEFSVFFYGCGASIFFTLYQNVLIRSSNFISNSSIEIPENEYKNKLPLITRYIYIYSENRLLADIFDFKYTLFPILYFMGMTYNFLQLVCVINLVLFLLYFCFRIHKCYLYLNIKRKSKSHRT